LEEIQVLGSKYNFWELIWSNQGLNCINIEVWWPIKDLIEEIQDQGPKCKTRANWRPDFKSDAFWRQFPFKWNDTFWKKQRRFIHCSLIKKNREEAKMVSFWTAPYVIFFPWTRREQGNKIFFSLLCLSPTPSLP